MELLSLPDFWEVLPLHGVVVGGPDCMSSNDGRRSHLQDAGWSGSGHFPGRVYQQGEERIYLIGISIR